MTIPSATAELPDLRQDIRDLLRKVPLSDLTVDELRDMRAPLLRARKRVLAGKVVPLRTARRSQRSSAHPPWRGPVEPTVAELFAGLEHRDKQSSWSET